MTRSTTTEQRKHDSGFLAIWSDVATEQETDYVHWLTREHTGERLGVEGFLSVRVFRSRQSHLQRYFILYELETPDVLGSAAYLARLNAPSPWSQRIMPTLGNFIRGGGRVVAEAGVGQGGVIAPLRLDSGAAVIASGLVEQVAKENRITAVRLLETDQSQTSIATTEKGMRARDQSFGHLLLIEGTDDASVTATIGRFGLQRSEGTYSQVFSL